MEDGFESFHVPQQSRRDKLRVSPTFLVSAGYDHDPSILTPDMLTCANPNFHELHHTHELAIDPPKPNPEPSGSFMNSSSSLSVNPNLIQHINNNNSTNQFIYTYQNLRDLNQSFNGDDFVSFKTRDSNTTGQGLSLSLSSHHRHNYLPSQLNPQQIGAVSARAEFSKPSDESSRSLVPLGPFTGYASILNRSKFLQPAQQLLDDFCGVDGEMVINPPLESVGGSNIVHDPITCSDRIEHRWKNSRLVFLLDEVYKRYKLYCQQMQSVVASFQTVAGLGNAAPYVSFAIKAMSKHFSCLKNAILDQIQFTGKTLGYGNLMRGDENSGLCWTADHGLQSQKPLRNSAFLQHPVWRSQRGLPDRAVAMLRTWLFEHFLHPYPSDSDKQMLAEQTGLSRSQVSNWFINARVRIWKPMVEEMHMLETRQPQIPREAENQNDNQSTIHQPLPNPLVSEKLFWNIPTNNKSRDTQSERRNELSNTSEQMEEQINFSYSNLSTNHNNGARRSRTVESSGISLALGLHQNNGIELSGPLPMNIAHHFNPETNYEVYLRNDFEAQNRRLGKNLGG